MKVAIYCKASAQDAHPERQRADLEEYAKRMGYEYEVFEEKESSRGTRPIKQGLLKRIRAKEFDGLLIWKFDRWAKNLSELIPEIKDLLIKNIVIISLMDGIDSSNEATRQSFHILAAFIEFEHEGGWAKENDDNRRTMCKAYSPEGIIKQLENIEKEYKRDSISSAAKDGIECFVIKYLFGKESVNMESLFPELRDSKINGAYEIWITKNNYLPLKQSEEISYYSNEQNKGTSLTNISYLLYNDDRIKIDKPVLGSKTF